MEISAQQLAELLLGIARAQAAHDPGPRERHGRRAHARIIPALQNVAHLHDHPQPTLTDLPVRVLLGTLGRQAPDAAGVVRDLERLLGGGDACGEPRLRAGLEILRLAGNFGSRFSRSEARPSFTSGTR